MTTMQVDDLKNKGNSEYAAGNHSEALRLFTQAIDLDPQNAILLSNRSACHASLGQWEAALEDAEEACRLRPDWAKGWGRKGAALLGLGEGAEAMAAYQRALELEPGNASLQKGLEQAQRMPPTSSQNPFKGAMAKLAGHPEMAKHLADPAFVAQIQALERDPQRLSIQDPRMLQALSILLGAEINLGKGGCGSKGDCADAGCHSKPETKTEACKGETKSETKSEPSKSENKCEKLAKEDPKAREVEELRLKGNEAYKAKQFEEALRCYNAVLEMDPNCIPALNNKAAVLFETEQLDECIAVCELAVERGREVHADFKTLGRALGRIGSAWQKKGDLEQAIRFYNKSLAEHRCPDMLERLRQAERDLRAAQKAALYDPMRAEAAREAGNGLFREGKWAEAVERYSEAIVHDEADPRAYANRAACYLKLGAVPEGVKDCNKCLELDPTFVKAHLRKAALLHLQRDYAGALEVCEQGLKHDGEQGGKHQQEFYSQMMRTQAEIQKANPEEAARNNPEVQEILADPAMRLVLQQMQQDPKAAADHLRNPVVAGKIRKLMAAGIIKTA